jgi:hypothetical protein
MNYDPLSSVTMTTVGGTGPTLEQPEQRLKREAKERAAQRDLVATVLRLRQQANHGLQLRGLAPRYDVPEADVTTIDEVESLRVAGILIGEHDLVQRIAAIEAGPLTDASKTYWAKIDLESYRKKHNETLSLLAHGEVIPR